MKMRTFQTKGSKCEELVATIGEPLLLEIDKYVKELVSNIDHEWEVMS